jgi:hypothetical protein
MKPTTFHLMVALLTYHFYEPIEAGDQEAGRWIDVFSEVYTVCEPA